jgi:hypothetical protein
MEGQTLEEVNEVACKEVKLESTGGKCKDHSDWKSNSGSLRQMPNEKA